MVNRGRRIRAFLRIFFGIAWDFFRETRLTRKIGGGRAREKMARKHRKRAIKLRETAIELGGVLIKLGQFLGARVDVMPEPYIQELMKLHDEVPPAPFNEVKALIEREFDKPLEKIFKAFDPEPEAAASLAQVHSAFLPSGEKVAVKVQRPGLENLINIDLATFAYLMEGLRRFTRLGRRFDIAGMVEEFARTLGEELDFFREGYYADRFRKNFQDDEKVYIPKVYWEYTTDRILTLEHVRGIKINRYEELESAGIDRHQVARELVRIYIEQFLKHGFFHADPHPGNLFVMPGPIITFVDFGMTGEIASEMREQFKRMVTSVVKQDINEIIGALTALGFLRGGVNLTPIRNSIEWMFENYAQIAATREVTYESLEEIQEDIRTIMYEQPFNLPSQFAFLGRAFATLLGLVTGLDPQFDLVEEAKPYVRELMAETRQDILATFIQEATSCGKTLLNLPRQLERTLTKAERGELKVRNESPYLAEETAHLTRARYTLALAIFSSSLVIGSVLLLINHLTTFGYIMLASGIATFLGGLLIMRGRRTHPLF